MSSQKRLVYDIRVSFNDSEAIDQSFVNNITHQFLVDNPEDYTTRKLTLNGTVPFDVGEVNFLFAASDDPFKVIFDKAVDPPVETEFLVAQHISFVNLTALTNVVIMTPNGTEMGIEVQIFFGTSST